MPVHSQSIVRLHQSRRYFAGDRQIYRDENGEELSRSMSLLTPFLNNRAGVCSGADAAFWVQEAASAKMPSFP